MSTQGAKKLNIGLDDFEERMAVANEIIQSNNVPRQIFPKAIPPEPKTPVPPREKTPKPELKAKPPKNTSLKRFSVDLPTYVIDTLSTRTFHEKTSQRHIFLEALNSGGLQIKPADVEKIRSSQSSPVKRYSVDVPAYVIDDISTKAFKAKTTVRLIVLQSLNNGGISIKPADLGVGETPHAA